MKASKKITASVVIIRSEPVAPDPRVEKTAQALSRAGANVLVLACDQSGKYPKNELKEGWSIVRFRLGSVNLKGLANLLSKVLWQIYLVFWLVRHAKEYDIIHACNFDTVLPALIVQKLFSKKVVYDIFDFYADTFNRVGGQLKQTIRNWEISIIRKPDAIILADEKRVSQIAGSKPQKLEFIYNSPPDMKNQLKPMGRPLLSQFHISYVGMLEYRRMLKELIDIVKNHPEWSLSLAGFGRDEMAIKDDISNISNISWYGVVSYQQALELNCAADTLFAAFDPRVPNHQYSSPNKLFEAMMLGKPIIVAKNTAIDDLVGLLNSGVVISYGNSADLEEAINKLASNPSLKMQLGQNARIAYEQEFSWNRMADRLVNLYEFLCEN